MTTRSRLFSLVVALCVTLSITLASTTSGTAGAGLTTHQRAGSAARCAHRNKTAGTVKFSDWEFPDTLNPYQTTTAVAAAIINSMLDSLVYFDQKPALRPQMLSTLPSTKNGGIKDKGKTVVLRLNHGLHWSNGSEITSQDVKFSWRIAMDKGSGPLCAAIGCNAIARIDTPDKYTDVLHLSTVYAGILTEALSFPIMPHVWSGAWGSNDVAAAVNKLINDSQYNFESPSYPTSGAYQATQFVNNDRVVLTPMKYYTGMVC